MDYITCKNIAKTENIKSAKDWFSYCGKNKNVTYHPERVYKKDWLGWYSFLNKENVPNRKYILNEKYFNYDSRNKYYVLGLICADGYIDKKHNSIKITQHKKDKYILDNILKEFGSNYKTKVHYDNNLYFCVNSKKMCRDVLNIIKYKDNKSFDLEFPKIPKQYICDFVRGFFDGDGCITYQKNEKCYVSSIVSASKDFIYELLDVLRCEIKDFKGSIFIQEEKYYIINIGVNDTRRLGRYLYQELSDDILYLRRKKEKFDDVGEIRIATFNKEFMTYEESRKYIKSLGITKYKEWRKYKKNNKIENVPSNPDRYDEYTGWKDYIS